MNRFALAARTIAILIAVAAVIDPSIGVSRHVPPLIAVVGDSSATLSAEVTKHYRIVRGPFPAAAGTIVTGQTLPRNVVSSAIPVFGIASQRPLWIDTVIAPSILSLHSRTSLIVRVGHVGGRGTTVQATLSSKGLELARASATLQSAAPLDIVLPFTALAPGVTPLTVTIRRGNDSARATLAIEASDRKWTVLFYDPRPSWMSTFVRRAVEADPGFAVGLRVSTSRSITSTVSGTPKSLLDPAIPELYDVIAVGAPDQLSAVEVSALEAFIRRRGGSVILLFDEPPLVSQPVSRLLSVSLWSTRTTQQPAVARTASDTAALRATELAWPARANSEVLPLAIAQGKPVVWSAPMGAGQLIVSGALDAWRYRDANSSAFDAFWRATIGDAAADALPPVVLAISRRTPRPGQSLELTAMVRDVALSARPMTAEIAATLDDSLPLTFWPTRVGQFRARLSAPSGVGTHHVSVVANGNRERLEFTVDTVSTPATPDERELIAAWARATGGEVVASRELETTLDATIPRASRVEQSYLMRSPWWIAPFALLLAFEWWWRRRNGNS